MEPTIPQGIPEERVQAVLARAAELDRQIIPVDAIRAAALEAGISGAAVDQALEEYASGRMAVEVATPREHEEKRESVLRAWLRKLHSPIHLPHLVTVSLLGLGIGAVGALGEPITALLSLSGFVLAGALQASRDRITRSLGRFQLSTVVLTASATLGLAASEDEFIAMTLVAGLVLFVAGSVIVHLGIDRTEQASRGQPVGSGAPAP